VLALTTRASIIGGAICIALLLLLSALSPEEAAGWTLQEAARATNVETRTAGSLDRPAALFSSEELLEFTLEADFKALKKDRGQESEYRPGQLILTGSDGEAMEVALKVRTRGNFRLDKLNCSFPPLKLDLPKGDLQGTILDGQNKLKLVTHCRDRDDYEQNLLEEYLAYRIYNLLTDESFRVQLARVTYFDSNGDSEAETRYAFLIESKPEMEARLGGTNLEVRTVHPDLFQPEAAGRMYLFQYLIGNVDWSLVYFHNVKLFRIDSQAFPIPYDFDWSGLVSAPYAKPHPGLAHVIRTVRQRLFRGFCSDRIDYSPLMDQFKEIREEVIALIQTVPGLTDRNVRSAKEYVEEFYEVWNDPQKARKRILDACRPI